MAADTPLRTLLLKHYAPQGDQAQRILKSTSALARMLDEHAPGKVTGPELYELLIAEGFQDRLLNDDLVWMLYPVNRS